MMKVMRSLVLGCLMVVMALWGLARAQALEDFTKALKGGQPTFEMRWSFEYSDFDDKNGCNGEDCKEAVGFNVRTRLGYRTGEFMDMFSAYIQLHNVTNITENFRFKHNGNWEGDSNFDVIADPDGSRVHQAYLDIKLPEGYGLLRVGKQEILHDDVRFIGNINWRQNGQSFDAIRLILSPIKDVEFEAAYVSRVNTINLDHFDLQGYWFHLTYKGLKNHKVTLFAYLNDFDRESNYANNKNRDSATYGIRLWGKVPFQTNMALRYDLTYAYQTDFADDGDRDTRVTVRNKTLKEHGANFFNIFLGTDWKLDLGVIQMASFGFGYQYIEGADGSDKPFDTLFSTAHKWNGWADLFLATNNGALYNGLKDYWVEAGVKFLGMNFKAVYHYFDSDTKVDGYALDNNGKAFDDAYGQELDLLLVKSFNKNIKGLLKAAFFDADSDAEDHFGNTFRDKTVFWARLMINF